MALMLEGQALMRRALMDAWVRLLSFSTILEIDITLALMATRAINVIVLLVFSLCWKRYMGRLRLEPSILMLIQPQVTTCSYDFFASLVPYGAMRRERGKPHQGAAYYSRFGWHNHPETASRAHTLGGDHTGSSRQNWPTQSPSELWPHHNQGLTSHALDLDEVPSVLSRLNWYEQAQLQTRPPNTENLQGGCPMEEEFSPNWAEFLPLLPLTVLERQPATCTTSPLQESVAMGCIVEEEALPL